jgi:cytochrome oxidase assembly protein ShyY1
MARYQFLRTPRWILFTLLVIVLIIVMINLALWQLRRLHQREAFNHTVTARTAAAPAPFDRVIPPGTSIDGVRPAEWTTVVVTGTFDPSQEVLIRNRANDGQPGYHVVTPLRRSDGTAVLVNRGWIPLATSSSGTTPEPPAPPTGTVEVEGRVRPTQNPGAFQHRDPPTGHLTTLARIDIPRVAQQTPYPLEPVYVEMSASRPAPTASLPVPVPLPALDNGPHLGYAFQWAFFSLCAVAGWVLVVRKSARARDRAAAQQAAEHDTPEGALT